MFNGLWCDSGRSAGRRQLDAVVILDVFAAFPAVSDQLPADDSFFSFPFSHFFSPQLPIKLPVSNRSLTAQRDKAHVVFLTS